MKEYYEMQIAGLTRKLPICKLTQDLCIAGFVIFGDPDLTVAAAGELVKRMPEHDYMITAEAKGIPLIHEMARQAGKPYIVARKGAKLYMQDVVKVQVNSITTDHMQTLCLGRDEREQLYGKRVLIVDDVISTGESLNALMKLAEKAGCEVIAKAAVLAEGDAAYRNDIIFLQELPIFKTDDKEKA